METMKKYIQPETIEVRLLSDKIMGVAPESVKPAHVGTGGAGSGSMMFDVPGNKRRQL